MFIKFQKPHVNPYMNDDIDDFVVSDGEDIDYSKAIRYQICYFELENENENIILKLNISSGTCLDMISESFEMRMTI